MLIMEECQNYKPWPTHTRACTHTLAHTRTHTHTMTSDWLVRLSLTVWSDEIMMVSNQDFVGH